MNTAILLTTRYKSKRLPGKHLFKINGKTVTDILIERLKKTKIPIIMCIPNTLEDEFHMKPVAERQGIGFFCGNETNIIRRHLDCMIMDNIKFAVNVDGDDTLSCPEVINAVMYEYELHSNVECIRTDGLPLGLNIVAYAPERLAKVNFNCDTGWGQQVINAGLCATVKFNYGYPHRLTLDRELDFEVIKDILTNCKRNITVGGICSYLKKHPDIAALNRCYDKEYWERIKEAAE